MIEGEAPDPISVRTATYPAGTTFPRQGRPWGELNYALSGVCEFVIAGRAYLSPPSYGIWIPPGVEHQAWNRQAIHYATVYVAPDLCGGLPAEPRTIAIDPLLKAIVADFSDRGVAVPQSAADHRLAHVLVDRVIAAPRFDSYLPASDDPLVAPVIAALQADPGDRTSLDEWARRAGVTDRTLSRRWAASTGLGFHEWRQRAKLIAALTLLDAEGKVQDVADRLGYRSASAFVAMFHKMTGHSPTRMLSADER